MKTFPSHECYRAQIDNDDFCVLVYLPVQFVTSFVITKFSSKSDGSLARLQVLLLLSIGADMLPVSGAMKHPIWMSFLQLSIPRLTLYLKRDVKLSEQEGLQSITSARTPGENSGTQLLQSRVILQCIGKGHQCITSLLAAVQKQVTSCPSHISLDCGMQCKLLATVTLTPENLMNKIYCKLLNDL